MVRGLFWKSRGRRRRKIPYPYFHSRSPGRILDSGFTERQAYIGLDRAWQAFIINNDPRNSVSEEYDTEKRRYYAAVIQKLEHDLGRKITSFPDLNLLALAYFEDNAEYLSDEITGEEVLEILRNKDQWYFERLREEAEIKIETEETEREEEDPFVKEARERGE